MTANNSPMTEESIKEMASRFAFVQNLFSYAALSGLLRLLGAGVLVASVSIFLMQGWQGSNDVERYLLLLAHTGLLAVTGFASSRWIKENKGARLFLGLALVSVPVNFAIVGGLIYSQIQWGSALAVYPQFATWQAGSLSTALGVAGGAFVLLLAVTWFGFLALARRSANRLTFAFMLLNAALLLPIRSAEAVGVLMALMTLGALVALTRLRRNDATLANAEGRFARLVQFLPVAIVGGRSLYLYAADTVLFTVFAGLVFLVLRQIALELEPRGGWRTAIERLSVIPALFVAFGVTSLVVEAWPGADYLVMATLALSWSALLLEISLRADSGGAGFRRAAVLILAGGLLANLFLLPSIAWAAVCLFSGIAIMVYGFSVEQRIVFAMGIVTLLAGLGYQVNYVVHVFDLGSWGSLATLGISAILLASVLERHGLTLRSRLSNWSKRLQSWQY